MFGPLAETHGAHLRERADRLRKSFSNRHHAGDSRGTDGSETDQQHAKLAAGRIHADGPGGPCGRRAGDDRTRAIREILRVLRPGGRVVGIRALPRAGIAALLTRGSTPRSFAWAATSTLQAKGFRSVRTLAERDGL